MAKTGKNSYLRYVIPLLPEENEITRFELDPRRRVARLWMPEPPTWIVSKISVTLLSSGTIILFHRVSDQGGDWFVVNLDQATFAELRSVLEQPRQTPPVARLEYNLFHSDRSPCGDMYDLPGPELDGADLEVFPEFRLARVYVPNITPYEGTRLVLEMYDKQNNDQRQRFERVKTGTEKDSWIYDFVLEPEAFDRLSRVLSNESKEAFDLVWTGE